MIVNVIKSGKWAENGTKVIDIVEGEQDLNPFLSAELIAAGWAEIPGEVVQKLEPVQNIELEKEIDPKDPEVENIEKGSSGWWSVKFKGVDEIFKVRGGKEEKKAIKLALEELEASK